MSKPIVAIMYDFDKTLSTTDMQNYAFIPNLGMTPDEFWGETGKLSQKYEVERILSYMYCMLKFAKEKGIKVTREYLKEFFPLHIFGIIYLFHPRIHQVSFLNLE